MTLKPVQDNKVLECLLCGLNIINQLTKVYDEL